MKIALAHDSFTQYGGAERVVEIFHELFPDAPVFTLVSDRRVSEKNKDWDIRTSQLQSIYLFIGKLQYLLPIVAPTVDSLQFEGFDLVLSSSSSFIKNIHVPKGAIHICYCHTPTRFLWSEPEYVKQEVPMLLQLFAKLFLKYLKQWDYFGAQRVTHFIANSKEVQERIKKYYNRDSTVIYPGIDTNFWKPINSSTSELAVSKPKKNYFLLAGRLQTHKNNEIVVRLFNELGLPLHIAGTGRQEKFLKSIASKNIIFLGQVSDKQLREEYSNATAYLFPQVEDFGLMPLEAASCGTPTVAFSQGGALETVIPGVTGELFRTVRELHAIIKNWQSEKYNAEVLRTHAEKFNKEKFKREILLFIRNHLGNN